MSQQVFARIRQACARVAERARFVAIDAERVEALAPQLAQEALDAPPADPARRRFADDRTTLAFVVTLDAINFGSGWFPVLAKPQGASGYLTISSAIARRFETEGPFSAQQLESLTPADCAELLRQDVSDPPVAELMGWYARALNDLGRFLLAGYGGRFAGPLEAAQGRAARLVEILASMPLYRDVARYADLEVPFYKRAQITAADLAAAMGGRGLGRFEDLDELTMFADNLVPHVLRCEGVLRYAPELAARIDAGEPIASGSPEEVEIRALALHAVELCAQSALRAGIPIAPHRLDALLWSRGQGAAFKARPRHRTRCTFY